MGYYTMHSLEILKGDDYETDYENEISEISGYGVSTFCSEIKWYDHDKVIRIYSTKHPNVVFKLSGEGEETGDIWVEYYNNGLMQREEAKVVVGDYNESKLK